MRIKNGDMYSISDIGAAGMNKATFLYVLLKAGTPGKFRILVLNTPDDWYGNPKWREFQVNNPISRVFGWRGPLRGNLSVSVITKANWLLGSTTAIGMEHRYVGNLVGSIESLVNLK